MYERETERTAKQHKQYQWNKSAGEVKHKSIM